ncbi:hypothetical protein ABZ905_08875 [Streptomyces parvus]|uniref:hypothetical protein n=1 Tax=Streptomyces parvus TaxID=66428 RepID=UPI0033F2C71C
MSVRITTENGKTYLRAPFHPDWPQAARDIGGQFPNGAWVFDARDEDRVRALAREIYGTDGTPDPTGTVTVRTRVSNVRGDRGGRPAVLYEFGRRIASRYSRDEPARLGTGVILVEGGFTPGAGTHSYIELGPLPGTVVEVRDVPRSVAVDHGLHIVDDEGPDRAALTAERDRLTARLAEIDALLGTTEP